MNDAETNGLYFFLQIWNKYITHVPAVLWITRFEIVRVDVVRFETFARAKYYCRAHRRRRYNIRFYCILYYIFHPRITLLLLLYRFLVGPTAVPSGCSANCAHRNFRCSEARKQYAQVNSARGVRRRGAVIVIIIIRHGGGGVRRAACGVRRRRTLVGKCIIGRYRYQRQRFGSRRLLAGRVAGAGRPSQRK